MYLFDQSHKQENWEGGVVWPPVLYEEFIQVYKFLLFFIKI